MAEVVGSLVAENPILSGLVAWTVAVVLCLCVWCKSAAPWRDLEYKCDVAEHERRWASVEPGSSLSEPKVAAPKAVSEAHAPEGSVSLT
jgi:hypothetical protein